MYGLEEFSRRAVYSRDPLDLSKLEVRVSFDTPPLVTTVLLNQYEYGPPRSVYREVLTYGQAELQAGVGDLGVITRGPDYELACARERQALSQAAKVKPGALRLYLGEANIGRGFMSKEAIEVWKARPLPTLAEMIEYAERDDRPANPDIW